VRLAWPQASEADSGQGDEAEVEGVVEGPVLKRNCDLQYHARPQAVEQPGDDGATNRGSLGILVWIK